MRLHEDPAGPDELRRFWDSLNAPTRVSYAWQVRTIPVERDHSPDFPVVVERQFTSHASANAVTP